MKKSLLCMLAVAFLLSLPAQVLAFGSDPEPPGQPATGYGSSASYLGNGYTATTFGSMTDGTFTYVFVPDVLKNGSSAPVIVQLHGAMLLGMEIYWDTIRHFFRQGYIVIHPQFNKGYTGIFSDTDQYEMIARAIDGVNQALSMLGSVAETDNLYLYGHSLGGLMAMCWEGAGGPPAAGRVLAHPCIDASTSGFVPDLTELDYEALAPEATGPVIILGGNQDEIAPLNQQIDAYNALTSAGPKKLFYMHGDWYGSPNLDADHMAPICDDGIIPGFIMDLIGGDGEVDALDWRFYNAAVDAMMDGVVNVPWNMGEWSDGTPVNTPVDETP